jgi:protein phosphatase
LAGEVAARVAADAIVEWMSEAPVAPGSLGTSLRRPPIAGVWPFGYNPALGEDGNRLRTAIQLANLQVLEVADTSTDYAGMGTTIVAAIVRERTLVVAHAGDSRAYLFAGGRLRRLTTDDTWIESLEAERRAGPGLRRSHPMLHALTNAIGVRPALEVNLLEQPLSGGELIVLTTDGVHGVLDDSTIERILGERQERELPQALVRRALERGSRDNCTAVVARYERP